MISVVTITFNNYEDLIKTFKSLNDAVGEFEHIIIDGGSCLKTKDFLKNTFKGKYISEPDKGIADAFNKGLKLSEGNGVIFLNSGDVLVQKNYLLLADEKLKNYDFVYADTLFDDSLAGIVVFRGFKNFGRGMPYPHQTLVVAKSMCDRIGQFSLNYKIAMDYDFVCRMYNLGARGYYHQESVTLMDGGGISSTREKEAIEETKIVLKANDLWTWSIRLSFLKKVVLFNIRQLLMAFGLNNLVIFIKRQLRK